MYSFVALRPVFKLSRTHVQPHDIVYEHLTKRELLYTVDKEFDSPGLFTGSVLTLDVCASPALV